MAVHKKSKEEIKLMKEAGNIVALVHQEMRRIIEPGVSTKYLDEAAHKIIKEHNLRKKVSLFVLIFQSGYAKIN